MAILIIDRFKRFNDQYGHVMGDKILQSFAKILHHLTEDCGFCARYGGEEFVVLLPGHCLDEATKVAEKIRLTTERMQIKQRNLSEAIDTITTSLGVARYAAGESTLDFISRTDALLYDAKETGRNRVVTQTP